MQEKASTHSRVWSLVAMVVLLAARAVLAPPGGAAPATLGGTVPSPDAGPSSGWFFVCVATDFDLSTPIAGISFTLTGLDLATGTRYPLASGTTGSTGQVALVTGTQYDSYTVTTLIPWQYGYVHSSCPSCNMTIYSNGTNQWTGNWPRVPPNTYVASLFLYAATPTPTPTPVTFSGRVYEGATGQEPPQSTPLQGATVTLWGSNTHGVLYKQLGQTTTDINGWYSLTVPSREEDWEYYHIVQTNLPGYISDGATSVGGVVIDADWIEYVVPLGGKVLTGNKFWDRLRATYTPTLTRTPSKTPTFTATRPGPTATPTRTSTLRPTSTRTPTPTRPGDPTATLTRTPTRTSTPTRTPTRTSTRPGDPTATHTATRPSQEQADLRVDKLSSLPLTNPISSVSNIEYYLVVRNLGPDVARNVVLTDVLTFPVVSTGTITGLMLEDPLSFVHSFFWTTNEVMRMESRDIGPSDGFAIKITPWLAPFCGPLLNNVTITSDAFDPDLSNNQSEVSTIFGPCPEPPLLQLTKTLVDPAGGVAGVGDVVRFRIELHNPTGADIGSVTVQDHFALDDFDLWASAPPPDDNQALGTDRILIWSNLTVPASGSLSFLVELKPKRYGVTLRNCATFAITAPGVASLLSPPACAEVRVEPLEGRHFTVTKRFTQPSNHVAQISDQLRFGTYWTNTGTETASAVGIYDYLTPPSTLPWAQFPYSHYFNAPHKTGDQEYLMAWLPAEAHWSPLVNTAEWTVTWPDGQKETKVVTDYVYVVDGEQGKGLYVNKRLVSPLGGAVISDTVTYQIVITNVTGADLPVLSLQDTFPDPCLRFIGASPPPDGVASGHLSWTNLGPLPLGDFTAVEVRFHAEGICPSTLNCAEATYLIPGAPPKMAAACAPVTIRGPRPELYVVKRLLSPSPLFVGDVVEYEIEVSNAGDGEIGVVPLHDGYQAAHLEFDRAVPAPDAVDPLHGRMDWNNLGPLPPGGRHVVHLRLRAIQPALGALNCAETHYVVGASAFSPSDCAPVDIRTQPPSIRVTKERLPDTLGLPPDAPLVQGDLARYRIVVSNTGPTPLFNVVVDDRFDPDCAGLASVSGPAVQLIDPGVVRWRAPTLPVGASESFIVTLSLDEFCSPFGNCVIAQAEGPEGEQIGDESCVALPMAEPEPGIAVKKHQVAPERAPQVGEVVEYEIVARNTGNTTLGRVMIVDFFDADCVEFVAALPGQTHASGGEVIWDRLEALPPGGAVSLNVLLRIKANCGPMENCARALWMVGDAPRLEALDCVPLVVAEGIRPLYLPLILRNFPAPTPTATPTRTATRPPTPTSTGPAPTATPTRIMSILSESFSNGTMSGWTPHNGTWTNPSDYLRGEHTAGGAWCMSLASEGDISYEGKVNLYSGNAVGLTFRSSADGDYSYDVILDAVDGAFKIGVRPPYAVLASHSMTVQRNYWYTIGVVARGSLIEAYLDGVKLLSVSDTTYSTGLLGVNLFRSTAGYDDLIAYPAP